MRRKSSSASRVRLSPNEEAQLVREELESRRKLRLQQVREQERYIARQVRRQVQERRQQQLQILADSLQLEWQQQHTHKLQALSRLYQHNLKSVGHGHRSAQENEPDLEALAQKSVERQERAEERHREALRELSARRHDEEQQHCRHIEARRKALVEEKKRAVRVASLPPPPPNPVESIGKTTARPLKSAAAAAAERFSVTHCHMPQTTVDRETHTEQQPSAQQAAALEFQRLEELWREEARDRQEQLEKARLRGNHALRREQNTQDRARLLCELERLQQADLLRRRQAVNSVPAQIFQPLYRQEELRDEQQRDLEIAFQDVYTEERKVKGDLVLQLVPEPLPPLSAASHDEELDVTLDPECAPEGEEPDTPVTEAPDPGRRALRRLLDRIRSQRARQRAAAMTPSHEGDAEVLSVETGSLSSQEKAPEGSSEEQMPSPTHTDDGADVSDEAVVAGTLLPPEERDQPMPASAVSERRATHEELLLRQQQEQLTVLEELEQKRRELEQRLRETQQMSETLQEAAQRRPVIQESAELPEPPPEVDADDLHTQRLHQYQQRLLQQNRLHKKSVEEARRRLQEYQHSLKLRYGIGSTTAVRATLQQPSVSSETAGDGTRASLPLIFNPDACAAHPGNAPASQFPALPVQTPQALFSPPKPVGSDSSRPSVLSEGPPLEARAQDGQEGHVPLPPPAVVLELLRSRLHQAACAVPQPADITGSVTAPSSGPAGPVQREEEADRQEMVRRHMRRQRDALQALITADIQASVSDSSGAQADQMILNTLLNAIEEANRPPAAPIQQDGATLTLSNDGVYDPAPVNRGRVKPPVSRPPARLAFLRQMEQHELSAIQEVDTPVNISLDTELQSAADVSESSSASLPALTSDGSHSPSDRSQVTGRISRMSWREMLLQDSTPSRGPSSVNQQQQEERFSAGCPSSVDPDYLSSTTISTGSYFTSDREPDDSHLCIDPDEYGLSPADRSHEMSGSVQQIIDKYSKELNASLRHAGVHAGAVNSECQSWSSVLHEEARAHDGDAAQISDAFLPLQPHPDIDSSSSSSSSRNAVRDDQSSRAQGWSETVNRILERLSDQLSLGHGEQAHSSAPSEPSRLSSSPCTDQDRASDSSHFTNESLQSMMNGAGHVSNYSDSHSSAELQDHSASRERFDGGQSVLSQLIGRASDIGSSQVFDQSSALAGGLQEVTQSTVAIPGPALRSSPDRPSEIRSLMSPALRHPDEDRSAFTDAPHDDASDLFLPLPSDVTNNESVDCSTALCVPLEAEKCGTDASVDDASDWLESSDQSLPSLQHLRTDTPIQSQADLQISMEQLSLTHESVCETDVVADPTVMDVSRMPRSPLKTCLQEESLTPTVQLPSQEVTSASPQHQSAVEENMLRELLERAQAAGDVKGILEESTISFISLPESTLQDPDLTEDSGSEPQEVKSDHSEGKAPSRTVEENSQSEDPEPSFPHAVMLLEFQCSPAQRQRREGLAQRSALRAAQIKARHSTTRLEQHVSRATGRTALKSDRADGLKSVAEVRICTAAQRRVEEAEMHRRTERLYSQLEEVKRQKEFRSRQESYAKNREKARDFQRKTLEKLRARLKP